MTLAKEIAWIGEGNTAHLWPPMPDPPPTEITITEGEFDAAVLNYGSEYLNSGVAPAFSVKSSTDLPSDDYWPWLKERGLARVWLCTDLDNPGRKARLKLTESIEAAGIEVIQARPKGIDLSIGETDVRDVGLRLGHPVYLEPLKNEDDPRGLEEIEPATDVDLVGTFVHPDDHTVLFGDGGVGKGVVAADWVVRWLRLRAGNVLVLDYERHASHEWRPRIEAFGGLEALTRVKYAQPSIPIWELVGWLRTQCSLMGVSLIVVDSVTYACVGSDVETSATAIKYSMAVGSLHLPVLSLAHVTKNDLDPTHPFGSVQWSNGARITWGMSRQADPLLPRILKNRKANTRMPAGEQSVDWTWLTTGLPQKLTYLSHYSSGQIFYEDYVARGGSDPSDEDYLAAIGRVPKDTEKRNYKSRAKRSGQLVVRHT